MIVTLTFNPAVDHTVWVERLLPGTVHRVREAQLDPAGKGINASRMAHRLGAPTVAFGLTAGETGRLIERALDAERVPHHFVHIPGESRIDTTVVDGAGAASGFYGIGPTAPADRLEMLFGHVRLWLPVTRVLVLAGSLLPGMPEGAYEPYVKAARERGVFVILDTHGAPLRRGLAGGPDLIKPNLLEAEGLLGRKLPDLAAVTLAARELAKHAGAAIVSMGERGAICVQGERAFRLTPPRVVQTSSVGSGDAMLAGIAVAISRGQPLEAGLRLGAAAGAATAQGRGTALGSAEATERLLPQVKLEAV